jgi:hypothetical protein
MASFYGFAKTEKAAGSQRLHAALKAGIKKYLLTKT